MKTFLLLLCVSPLIAFAGSPTDEFQAALIETGITARPQPPSFGERLFDPYFLEDVKKLPADRKEKLAAQIAQLTPQLAQEWLAQPIPRGVGPTLGILLLQEIGTDEQKVQAFRDLDLFGRSLGEACRALATCEGGEGVKVLKKYAESQFPGIDSEFSQSKNGADRERYAGQNPPSLKLYQSVIALSGAYHSDGPVAAEKLRDQLINLSKEHLNASQLAELKKEFDKDMEEARRRRENLIREKRPDNKRNLKTGSINTETPSAVSDDSSRAISSEKWFWPGISIVAILLFLACRILIIRKAAKSFR